MTTLQFGLFFAALLIGYVLVHIRLMRFETYLREVSALRIVNERLQGVSDVLNRVDLAVVEERLEMISDRLGRLSDLGERLERALERGREPTGVAAAPPAVSAGERLRALVEARLSALGYRNLIILTNLDSIGADEQAVTVECEKNQTTFKGKVVTCNGEIRDVNLQSVTQAFP